MSKKSPFSASACTRGASGARTSSNTASHAARDALADAGVSWKDVQFVSGAETMRCGYPGYVAGATFAQALGWQGAEVNTSYAACASGLAGARRGAREDPRRRLRRARWSSAPTRRRRAFSRPPKGERPDDPDWVRFRIGITNPTYFALYARRRMDALRRHRARLRAGQGEERRARLRPTRTRATARNSRTEEVLGSPMVADPLRLLEICATCDGGAAVVLSRAWTTRRDIGVGNPVRIAAISTVTPTLRQRRCRDARPRDRLGGAVAEAASASAIRSPKKAYEEAGIGPRDVSVAEVYDLSSALELDWYENIGLCARAARQSLLRAGATRIGGRIPVNPSGGLACFGEAVPAQALAQVCELTWQLRGQAGERQVEGAKVGITANQGLFGHGSSVIVTR